MTVPSHAENVAFSTVFKTVREPSKYVPGKTASRLVVECPACEAEHADFPVTETLTCNCGLSMRCEYGQVFVWRDKEVSVATS